MSINWWMLNKMWYIHKMNYYSERKKAMTHATIWMSLENTTLSKRCQSERTTNCMNPRTWCVQTGRDKKINGCQRLNRIGKIKGWWQCPTAWLVWPSGTECCLRTKGHWLIPSQAHAWVGDVKEATDWWFSHTLMFVPLSFFLPSPSLKNK